MHMKAPVILPPRLERGDQVALVTVSAPEAAQNPHWVERGLNYLRQLDLKPLLFPRALANEKTYLADEPSAMADDIHAAFRDPGIKALICTGGGTNANRLLPHLDYELIRSHPKAFIGMSNPTAILNAIYVLSGLVTFHGPVLVWNFGAPDGLTPFTLASFRQVLWRAEPPGPLPDVHRSWKFLKGGTARGRLVGGNLWTLQSLLGTPYMPDWDGTILFWEDVAKEPKRLDAVLTHFRHAGVFDRIVGMVVGRCAGCESREPSLTLRQVVEELTAEYSFPVLYDVCFGHTDDKLTLPIGAMATLDSATNTFAIDQAAVV